MYERSILCAGFRQKARKEPSMTETIGTGNWIARRPALATLRAAVAARRKERQGGGQEQLQGYNPEVAKWQDASNENYDQILNEMALALNSARGKGAEGTTLFSLPLEAFTNPGSVIPSAIRFEDQDCDVCNVSKTDLYKIAPPTLKRILDLHQKVKESEDNLPLRFMAGGFTGGGSQDPAGPATRIVAVTSW